MDITNITNFKPDTELRGENPFERTEIERIKKQYEPPEKRSKVALPVYMEKVHEGGVRLNESELEERRSELLAKAEIQVCFDYNG